MLTKLVRLAILVLFLPGVFSCSSQPSSIKFSENRDIDIKQMQKEAELAHRFGRSGEALFHYEQILKKDPENIKALLSSGRIYLKLNEPVRAESYFEIVLQKQPMNLDAREGRALSWLMQGDYVKAKKSFLNVLDEDKSRWQSINGLAIISDVDGDYEKSAELYRSALKLRPNDSGIMNNYGYSLIMSHKYAEAETILRDVNLQDQGNERTVNNLAIAIAWQKRYEEAVKVAATQMKKYVAYNNIGYIAYLNKDYNIASDLYHKAITLSPRYYKKAERNLELLNFVEK